MCAWEPAQDPLAIQPQPSMITVNQCIFCGCCNLAERDLLIWNYPAPRRGKKGNFGQDSTPCQLIF